ncbi:hypothetical protein ACTXT7_003757 [Hymenolepis weldensis]
MDLLKTTIRKPAFSKLISSEFECGPRHWELLQNRADANQQKKKRNEETLQQTRNAVSDALGDSSKREKPSSP